jgi:hypothetical protein
MDGIPQTTFIPRKPVSDSPQLRPQGGSMFLTFGILVLLVAVLISGGIFAYQQFYLQKNLVNEQTTLHADLQYFDPNLISQMSTLSNQLSGAEDVLDQHVALSILFNFLSSNTVASVRFVKFSYDTSDGTPTVTMDGQAVSFAALDAEENQLSQPGSLIHGPQITNVAVTKNGNVTFTISGSISPDDISYKNEIDAAATAASQPVSSPTQTPLE